MHMQVYKKAASCIEEKSKNKKETVYSYDFTLIW